MKILSFAIGACLLVNGLHAQQYYGQTRHLNTFPVTSAEVTRGGADRGYLYSFTNFNNTSTTLFSILQTNSLVAVGTPNTYYNRYEVSLNTPVNFDRCHGTQVVQGHAGGTHDYFVASCVSKNFTPPFPFGSIYLTWSKLDKLGQPIGGLGSNSQYMLLDARASNPGPVSVTRAHKVDEYFVCGSYKRGTESSLYIVKINNAGIVWRKEYRLNGQTLAPTAILQSQGDTNEVVMTVNVENASQSYPFVNKPAWGAFFMKFAGANGTLISNKVYQDYRFESVSATKEGYLISGCLIHAASPYYQPLMFEVKKTTNNVIWSSVFFSRVYGTSFTSAFQRRSPQSGKLEYFGAIGFSDTRDVIRLDSNAVLHAAGNNWFIFPTHTASTHPQVYMTFKNDGGIDNGFQLHGTQDDITSSRNSSIVRSYFNGRHSGGGPLTCIELQTVTVQSFITMQETQLDLPEFNLSTTSGYCGIKKYTVAISPYTVCGNYSIGDGSNARAGLQAGVDAETQEDVAPALFPNPSSGSASLKFVATHGEPVSITFMDITGRVLKTVSFISETDGERELELDLRSYNLVSGMYLIKTSIGERRYDSKLIYKKE